MNNSDIYKKIKGKELERVGLPEGIGDFTTQYRHLTRYTLEANRVFKTKEHMLAYINDQLLPDGTINKDESGNPASSDDTVKSALPGLILTVINDPEEDNNGMYYIENADPETTPGLAAKKIGPMSNAEIQQAFDKGTEEVNNQ